MEPFKNLISYQVAEQIARNLEAHYPAFPRREFLQNLEKELTKLELKERVVHIARRLKSTLPADLKQSLNLLKLLIKKNEMKGFVVWPLTEFVSLYGLEEFTHSMLTLKEMTKVFTAEFAVRAFFLHDQKKTLQFFNEWVDDDNEHVRRLVSEGSRPLLPWGQRLPAFVENPGLTWHLLEKLKDDPSLYVRKSVANHLNDHSKNHPDFVIDKLLDWKKKNKKNKNLEWVIRHSSRTLVKKGHPQVFSLHDINTTSVEVISQKIKTKKVILGNSLLVEVSIRNKSTRPEKMILDHEVHLLRSNQTHNVKCFKGKTMTLSGKETIILQMQIPLKAVTTRKYYGGKHFWNTKLNGTSLKKLAFTLEVFEE